MLIISLDEVEERLGSHASTGLRDEAAGPLAGDINEADKFRSTTTIATRGRVADTSLKSSLAQAAATVSRMHKPFVPLDFEAIRQGFLEGGVKSTDGNSKSSTSSNYYNI
jgi:hypothetical protein